MKPLSMPFQVGWDLVHECNLRCKHCYFTSKQLSDPRHPDFDQAAKFIRYIAEKGVFHLSLAGGEPLLYSRIVDLVREATANRLVVAMSTNAILLDDTMAVALREAGLTSLQISIDGSTAAINDEIRGKGSFERTLAGLRTARSHGFKVLVACVITRINSDDIESIVELAHEEGAYGVKVQTLIDRGLGSLNSESLALSEDETVAVLRRLWGGKPNWHGRLDLLLPLLGEVIDRLKDQPEAFYSQAGCIGCEPGLSTVRIDTFGGMRACGSDTSGEAVIGNVFETPLQELYLGNEEAIRWRNEQQVLSGQSSTTCGSVCGKGCRAATAPAFALT